MTEIRDDVGGLIRDVFAACHRLSELTGRPISPDGHLVGSLGEVHAASVLDLDLATPSTAGYDAVDNAGRKVEIKTTTRSAISLSASGTESERLVVVVLSAEGAAEVFFDGPSEPAWNAAGPPQKNGQRHLSLRRLAACSSQGRGQGHT
jgi:hypothetical protein